MPSKISIVNVNDYGSINDAVNSAIKLVEDNFHFNFTESKKILLKPNLLTTKENACTQPSFVEGIITYLKDNGVSMENIYLGDSPGQSQKLGSNVARKIGIYEICEEYGINFIDFESDIPIDENVDGALRLKKIKVAKIVKDCDILINLPRLKSHIEATMTGAIKNYWGIIPGGLKAKYHLLGKTAEQFGQVLVDNFSWVVKNKPNRLTVYDLQEIMEGPKGPGGGNMRKWDLILAGTDELALDIVALEIGKIKPKKVPHVKNGIERNLGAGNLDDIEVIGLPLEEAKKQVPKFRVPSSYFSSFIAFMSGHIGYKIIKKIPKLVKVNCVKCGDCAQNCPAEAIEFEEGAFPVFQRKKCISCFCCAELCSDNAISAKTRGLAGLFD
ncbi:hypothetical protein LCGC14_0602990 [marine sediment metagenome]|uniref:4Fe-4S ferredoxin-type domain-containing protein n=1 Tax=marine sediment metagenome TaxID=412755 RepID=A0A0F9RA69_9ZZZZ|nr:MAG: pyuvate ferredoxin oxidoreductase subunit delta [Candidatus Lokiarchaeum sp. GC14_75]